MYININNKYDNVYIIYIFDYMKQNNIDTIVVVSSYRIFWNLIRIILFLKLTYFESKYNNIYIYYCIQFSRYKY